MNKAAIKRFAIELRAEIDLDVQEPFDPYRLAALYGIPIIKLSELECSPEARQHFQVTRPEVFSGALIPLGGGGTVIVENDAHQSVRRRSTASHEMAHVTLEHVFSARLVDERRCRVANREQEGEADELGGELLLPFEAAKALALRCVPDEEAAAQFDVSVEIARWRLNSTGARKIAERVRNRARGR
jgi:hypothetical protein